MSSDPESNVIPLRREESDEYGLTDDERTTLLPFTKLLTARIDTRQQASGSLECAVVAARRNGVTEEEFVREARRAWAAHRALDT
jgi:hypothetical protein